MKGKKVIGLGLTVIVVLIFVIIGFKEKSFGQEFTLKSGHIGSPLSIRHKANMKFSELVQERTKGRVKIDVYPGEQLGNANAMFEAVSMGTQDIVYESVAWYSQFSKDFGYYNVPFIFNTFEELYKAYQSDIGRAMFEDVRKKVGIRCVAYNYAQALRSLYTVKKPVHTPADLEGLKMRVPGIKIYVDAWKILGANTVRVSWGELYTALVQGIVEAGEGPITEAYSSKFFEVYKNITLLNYKPSTLTVSFSEKKWQKLPKDIQDIIETAAKDAGEYFTKLEAEDVDNIVIALKKQGIVFVDFDRQAFVKKASGIGPYFEKEGMWSKGLHEKMMKILGRM